jgi:peptidoglycan/xylan/chitin deacetylase (PgdA/CDA1 family)
VADASAIPILTYHHVTPHPASGFVKYAVTPRVFARQMRLLALGGYHPISLDAWLANRHRPARLPAAPVVISFDDGFRETVEHAVPVLRRHGFPAIFFLVAGLLGKTSEWLMRERGLGLPMLGWVDAARLERAGFQVGSHTMTHARLTELSAQSCRQELSGSRAMLEDRLGAPVLHLAYPFGSYNAAVMEAATQAGYTCACTTEIGLSSPSEDACALRRIPVVGGESLLDFAARLVTGRSTRELWTPAAMRLRSFLSPAGRRHEREP